MREDMDTHADVNNFSPPPLPAKKGLRFRIGFWFGAVAVLLGALLLVFGGGKNRGYGIRFVTSGMIVAIVSRRKALSPNTMQGPS